MVFISDQHNKGSEVVRGEEPPAAEPEQEGHDEKSRQEHEHHEKSLHLHGHLVDDLCSLFCLWFFFLRAARGTLGSR